MQLAYYQRREYLGNRIRETLAGGGLSDSVGASLKELLDNFYDGDKSLAAGDKLTDVLTKESRGNKKLEEILEMRDLYAKKSVWVFGGDGWAYDIGFGGLDHVIAMNHDINIMVMDTEVYSNTGGQSSKASPTGAVAKFAASGKKTKKKDLAMIAMSYGYVYVASIALGAKMPQTVKAFMEAESYPGPSLIIAYAPCINHGIAAGMGKTMEEANRAVESGYWPLFRFDPRLRAQGKNPFQLDCKEPTMPLKDFLAGEVRYKTLMQHDPEEAGKLQASLEAEYKQRFRMYQKLAEGDGIL
jgi:pyruvate-ferredoxin/flavodoxin oxidoreductase